MSISSAVGRAFETIGARERDVMRSYADGAIPQYNDVRTEARTEPSADPLAVAAPANGLFIVKDERGDQRFTRDGGFTFTNGAVSDRAGRPLLGYHADTGPLAPLHADPVDVSLGLVRDLRIEADGLVSYAKALVDPKTGARESHRVTIGRIALARFPAASNVHLAGTALIAAPAGVVPHVGRPGDGNFESLILHARERSGIDIDLSLERLQEAYIAFDALRAAHKAQGSVEKTSMDLLK
ncbi:MAG: hypothetical protein M3Z07_03455 [Candidatus Eremiobacteraeota bacterium]|nr:hypothetical protein [Candidatus Eremiobacteraeota bacterium]